MVTVNSSETSIFDIIELFFNTINHIFTGFVAIYMSYVCFRSGFYGTSVHAWLCAFGYNFLMAEAILCISTTNSFTFVLSKKVRTHLHWILQLFGGGMGIGGAILMMARKETHFTTIHGIFGLIATIFSLASFLSGLSAFFAQTLRTVWKPILNKFVHIILGFTGFLFGMICLYFGYEKHFMKVNGESDVINQILQFGTILTLVLTLIGPIKTSFKYVRTLLMD